MPESFWLDKAITALVTLAAAWLGVRAELRQIVTRLGELRADVNGERARLDTHLLHHSRK